MGGSMAMPMAPPYEMDTADGDAEESYGMSGSMGGNLLTGQLAETFGAKTLEELFTLVPKLITRHRVAQSVEAIANAKQAGLLDLAVDLERQLRGDMGLPVHPAVVVMESA